MAPWGFSVLSFCCCIYKMAKEIVRTSGTSLLRDTETIRMLALILIDVAGAGVCSSSGMAALSSHRSNFTEPSRSIFFARPSHIYGVLGRDIFICGAKSIIL